VHDIKGQTEIEQVLQAAGVSLPGSATADSIAELPAAYAAVGTARVVLKAAGLLHKTDAGGVVLGLRSEEDVIAAAEQLLAKVGEQALPFLLQEQAEGFEMLVGARRDPQLGAAIVVGLGGTATELHQDYVTRLAPVTPAVAREMLAELRCWPLLEGYRGEKPRDVDALVDVVVAVSELVAGDPTLLELDLNPVLVGPSGGGAVVVDARVIGGGELPGPARPRPNLDRMMRPQHVAVIGVSDDKDKVGARLFRYLGEHGYAGRLDPVHPSGGTVQGVERARSLAEVDGSPDLVCVTVPSRFVVDVAREAVAKGVGGVLVHSSDFAESGEQGRSVQDELVRILSDAGIPLAGPNNMGIVGPYERLTASISGGLEQGLLAGSTALLTGSGALGSCLATRLMGSGVGLSRWVHAGNEADVLIADYLDWLADDNQTTSVGLLLEDVKDGPRFVEAGRRVARAGKPMFAYNMVRSDKGRQAALSHTGAMVGSFAVREAAVRAAGMVSVPSLQVLEDAMRLTATTAPPRGNRLMAVTFSGGACSIIADEAEAAGVDMPELSVKTAESVREHVPSYSAVRNPFDLSFQMLARSDGFERVLESLASGGEFDALLVQFTTNADPYAETLARKVVGLRDRIDIPLYVSRYGGEHLAPRALAVYREASVPVMDAPDRAAKALAAVMAAQRALRDAQ
jgi:acyl-CoA synthetase (NDP forming)